MQEAFYLQGAMLWPSQIKEKGAGGVCSHSVEDDRPFFLAPPLSGCVNT